MEAAYTSVEDCSETWNDTATHNTTNTMHSSDLVWIYSFGVISSAGLFGNCACVVAIVAIRPLRTAQNFFVCNLCFADTLLAVNAIFAFVAELRAGWQLVEGACRLFGFIVFTPPIAVALSMTVIAKDRHACITSPTAGAGVGHSRRMVVFYLGIVWVIAVAFAMPNLFGWVTLRSGLFCACCFYIADNWSYGLAVSAIAYVIPNGFIAYYYMRIYCHVRQSRRRVARMRARCRGAISPAAQNDVELRLAIQFIALFAIFNCCYTPAMLVFWFDSRTSDITRDARGAVMVLFALNLVLNPLAYVALNGFARRHLKHALRCAA